MENTEIDQTNKKLELFRKAVDLIIKKALEDQKITEEEQAIIDSVKESVEKYELILTKTMMLVKRNNYKLR